MINLKNKKVLITGASGGIGKSIVRKFVSLEDISEAAAFLSSPLSKSTTGQILKIDAGQTAI